MVSWIWRSTGILIFDASYAASSSLILLDIEEFRSYLEKCFDFEQVTVKKFRTWAERRQFNRDMKRKQAESERPILPANQKLITLSVQDAPTKKGERTRTEAVDYIRSQIIY